MHHSEGISIFLCGNRPIDMVCVVFSSSKTMAILRAIEMMYSLSSLFTTNLFLSGRGRTIRFLHP